jgi:hypothetical protein
MIAYATVISPVIFRLTAKRGIISSDLEKFNRDNHSRQTWAVKITERKLPRTSG